MSASADRGQDVINHFNVDGFDCLYSKYKGGRPRTFTLPGCREIKKIAKSKPAEHGPRPGSWRFLRPGKRRLRGACEGGTRPTELRWNRQSTKTACCRGVPLSERYVLPSGLTAFPRVTTVAQGVFAPGMWGS